MPPRRRRHRGSRLAGKVCSQLGIVCSTRSSCQQAAAGEATARTARRGLPACGVVKRQMPGNPEIVIWHLRVDAAAVVKLAIDRGSISSDWLLVGVRACVRRMDGQQRRRPLSPLSPLRSTI